MNVACESLDFPPHSNEAQCSAHLFQGENACSTDSEWYLGICVTTSALARGDGAALAYSRTVSVPHPHSPVVCLQVAGVALYPDRCRLDSRC